MQEKHLKKDQIYIMIFAHHEKAHDSLPIDIILLALIKKTLDKIQDMCDEYATSVRTLLRSTKSFDVKVGFHSGSTLSPSCNVIYGLPIDM